MRTSIFGVLALTLVFLTTSCLDEAPGEKGDTNYTTTESSELETFYAVRVGLASSTIIEAGNTQSYKIEASEEDLKKITVEVRKGTLAFGLKRGQRLSDKVKISVVGSDLESIQLSGSGRLEANTGVLRSSESSVVLSGSGTVRVNAEVATEITAILSGSGTIDLSGKGDMLDIIVSGSGDVKALDFVAQEVKINLSGSGNCEVDAVKLLNAAVTGSGDVNYTGNPEVRKRITGSGSIQQIKS